jgi:D-glucosaminate-6-phosphate ammonia-lyase
MGIYERLGVRRWINAAGYMTRLGGSLMPVEVLDAMQEAAASFVDIAELQAAASRVIARHTGAGAGLVTSGAAAALTLAAAACITGLDAAKMDRLPDTEGMANEIVMHRSHRYSYDHAIRAAGARIKDIGFDDRAARAGVRGLEAWEFEAAVTPRTAAIAFTAMPHNLGDLERVADVAGRFHLPVMVDAAAWLPPVENLRRFIDAGATLVAFSGGKALRGPQGTGFLCGERELIAAALLQQLDMNVLPDTWSPPDDLIPRDRLSGIPHHGIGRGFKVSKEDIVGLIVALERFASLDQAAEMCAMESILSGIQSGLAHARHVHTRLIPASETGLRPILELHFDEAALGQSATGISRALQSGTPPIHMTERYAAQGVLVVDPAGLSADDGDLIVMAVCEILLRS